MNVKLTLQAMNSVTKQYIIELSIALTLYALLLVGMNLCFAWWDGSDSSLWRYPLVVIPMIPAVFVVRAIVRYLKNVDELERIIQLQSLATAFATTAFITFTYGFLEGVGLPKLSMFWVWPLMASIWIIARLAVGKRYS